MLTECSKKHDNRYMNGARLYRYINMNTFIRTNADTSKTTHNMKTDCPGPTEEVTTLPRLHIWFQGGPKRSRTAMEGRKGLAERQEGLGEAHSGRGEGGNDWVRVWE